MLNISPPDIVFGIIILYFTVNGFRNGFIHEISKIGSMICGFLFAHKFHIDLKFLQ